MFDQGLIEAAELRALATFARDAAATIGMARECRDARCHRSTPVRRTRSREVSRGREPIRSNSATLDTCMAAVDGFGLSPHQRSVGDRVIAEEGGKREHVVVYLERGARLRLPLARQRPRPQGHPRRQDRRPAGVRGARPPTVRPRGGHRRRRGRLHVERAGPCAVWGILGGNGNFIERVLGRMDAAQTSALLPELRPLTSALRSAAGCTGTTWASP